MADKTEIIDDIETMLEDKRSIVFWIPAGSLMDILKLLKESPDVVLCKDCVHWIPGTIDDKDNFNRPRCKRNSGGWSADDYCSCAERR